MNGPDGDVVYRLSKTLNLKKKPAGEAHVASTVPHRPGHPPHAARAARVGLRYFHSTTTNRYRGAPIMFAKLFAAHHPAAGPPGRGASEVVLMGSTVLSCHRGNGSH
jgi:hypothetical protein